MEWDQIQFAWRLEPMSGYQSNDQLDGTKLVDGADMIYIFAWTWGFELENVQALLKWFCRGIKLESNLQRHSKVVWLL